MPHPIAPAAPSTGESARRAGGGSSSLPPLSTAAFGGGSSPTREEPGVPVSTVVRVHDSSYTPPAPVPPQEKATVNDDDWDILERIFSKKR